MAQVTVRGDTDEISEPVLVEGLPGIGLVGKIAADHLVDYFEMERYASVEDCEGIPRLAVYETDEYQVRSPIRIYADPSTGLMVLQSDVPVGGTAAGEFAECLTEWIAEIDATPLYLSGLPVDQKSTPPAIFGVTTGSDGIQLADIGVTPPPERGAVSGPTGALLARAGEVDLNSLGFIVESDPQFPDPEAARVLLKDAIGPIAEIDPPLGELVQRADDIRAAKEQLAERMQQVDEEDSTQAKPLRMYQ